MKRDPNLFTIGEFSQITGLSVKTLRFYDEKGLLRPVSVDPDSGYRFYDAACAARARIVARLRELQFSLEQIGNILAGCSDDADLMAHFQKQLRHIEDRIRLDRKTARALEAAISAEQDAESLTASGKFAVEEKTLAPLLVAGFRMQGRYAECGRGFKLIARAMGRHLAGKPLCLYYDGEFREEDADFEPCFPLRRHAQAPEGVSVRELPAQNCLTLVHQGPYPQLGCSYQKLMTALKQRGLTPAIPTREVFLKGPGIIFRGQPARYLTEIQIALQP
jgi:DNA-binding transcriptional MerR regulator/effector-binding domain-containing protein